MKINNNQSIVQMDTSQQKERSLFEIDIHAENLIVIPSMKTVPWI